MERKLKLCLCRLALIFVMLSISAYANGETKTITCNTVVSYPYNTDYTTTLLSASSYKGKHVTKVVVNYNLGNMSGAPSYYGFGYKVYKGNDQNTALASTSVNTYGTNVSNETGLDCVIGSEDLIIKFTCGFSVTINTITVYYESIPANCIDSYTVVSYPYNTTYTTTLLSASSYKGKHVTKVVVNYDSNMNSSANYYSFGYAIYKGSDQNTALASTSVNTYGTNVSNEIALDCEIGSEDLIIKFTCGFSVTINYITVYYQYNLSDATLSIGSQTYTGASQTASNITVNYSGSKLTLGKDYQITSNSGGTNVGGYTVKVTGGGNYYGTKSGTFNITQKALTITAKDQTVTYSNAKGITTGTGQVTADGLVSGDDLTAVTLTQSTNNATTSGTITPSAVGTSKGASNYSITYKTGKLTINPKPVSLTWGDAALTYNGTEQKPTCSISSGVISGTTCTVSVSGGKTDAGSNYTATASLSNSNYTISANAQKTFSISPKEVGLSWGTTSLTYTGDNQVPTCTATGLVSGTTCNVTVTGEKKNVGNYTATASSVSNTNYKLPSANTKAFSIAAKTLTVKADAKSKTYGESDPALTYTASGLVGSEQPMSGALTRDAGDDAGTYAITLGTLTAGTNYSISYTGADLTILPAAATMAFDDDEDVTKDFGDDNFTKAATKTGNDGSIVYSSGNESVATVNAATGEVTIVGAGTAVITAAVTGNNNYTYTTNSLTYTLTVNAVDATCTAPAGLQQDYTGEALPLVEAGVANGGEMHYRLGTEGTYSATIPTATEPGDYTIYYKVVADHNHNDTGEQSVSARIIKTLAANDVTVSSPAVSGAPEVFVATYAYDGSTHVPTIEVKDGDTTVPATIAYLDDSGQTIAADDIKEAGDYQAVVTFTGNYSGSVTVPFQIYLPGDANGDKEVNTGDLSALINMALGRTGSNYRPYAADMTGDGLITISDIVKMVDHLLGRDLAPSRQLRAVADEPEAE